LVALAAVLLLHGAVVWALLRPTAALPLAPMPVLTVALRPAAAAPAPDPKVVPPKPRPVARRPASIPPAAPAPSSIAVPESASAPAAEVPAALASPETVARAMAPVMAPVPAAEPPAPAAARAQVSAPRVDADYLDNPAPVYPAQSRRLKESGKTVLRVWVATSGVPAEVTVHASSGYERLDQAALNAVRRWRFVPAQRDGEPVSASVLVPVVFTLKDG